MIPSVFGLLLASCIAVTVVHGYGSGAPVSTCATLLPPESDHGKQSSVASNPYTVLVTRPTDGSSQFKVQFDGEEYEGVLIQARKVGATSTPFGSFSPVPSGLRSVACSRPTLTHQNSNDKDTNLEITWNAPNLCSGETVQFKGVIMYERYQWWEFEVERDIDWNDWSACSVTCGGGTQTRTSACGASDQTQPCNIQACSGFTFGAWSAWSTCTVECDQTRTRTCQETVTDACLNQNAQETRVCTGGSCPNVGSAESAESTEAPGAQSSQSEEDGDSSSSQQN